MSCQWLNASSPLHNLLTRKLNGTYFKIFSIIDPYLGTSGIKFVAMGIISIINTPSENDNAELLNSNIIKNKNKP